MNTTHTIEEFTQALLKPSMYDALAISEKYINEDNDIKKFWENIIVPSMYIIGNKWANAEITVGEEHTATSICQRVMAEYYEKILMHSEQNKEKIIVTISPNELHQVGARMVADLLELNGYDVEFLNSSCTIETILDKINNQNIRNVIISTTLVSSLNSTENLITNIRKNSTEKVKIYVGGQAYTSDKSIETNADVCISNVDELLEHLKENK
ncbi:MAG: cobalamin B12-binding domain-containing protein [Campylobacteraceae bacterium]|nr:cobalamin B12-binding domain-containing protein [Campylobacteraceae bacterium]